VGGEQADFNFDLYSGVRDGNAKLDFDFFPDSRNRIRFGAHYTYHRLTPSIATASSNDVDFTTDLRAKYAHEGGLYVQDEIKLSNQLSINAGLRFSLFSQVGPYFSALDSVEYASGEPIQTYTGWEPRISGRLRLSPNSSIKAGFSMAWQYIHLVSNSTSTLPFDVWVPSSERIKPQLGLQYAVGYFRNFANNTFEASVEAYYKDLENQIDFRESYVNDVTEEVEQNFVFGSGRAYGLEFFLKKRTGDLNGWLGYTLSRSERSFPDIENGRVFPAVYDRIHDLSLVLNYQSNPKWEFGLVFVYGTGRAFTPFRSVYFIEQKPVVNFGPRNSARFDAYHRLDLSATYTPNPESQKRFTSSFTFSVYNVYNRRNPLYIYTSYNSDFESGVAGVSASKVSIFPIIPSVTWNFAWKGN
jgi:outer membrane receptor for ferrienterochelin and colicin